MYVRVEAVKHGVVLGAMLLASCRPTDPGAGFMGAGTLETEGDPTAGPGPGGDAADGTGGIFDVGGTGIATVNPEATSGCAHVDAEIAPVIPTIVVLIDRSGSMSDDFGGISRWTAIQQTLLDAGGVVDTLQSEIEFGMATYTSNNGTAGGTCPILEEVPPALDNLAAMQAAFSTPLVEGDTPTGDAVLAVSATLAALDNGHPKGLVLATDGEPDSCAVPDPQTAQPDSLAAVQSAFSLGVRTFVVSVGPELSQTHLQDLANAGVGKAVGDPDPAPFYLALDAQQLLDAFDEIVGGFVSCQFAISGTVDLEQACQGAVSVDGMPLECPTQWHLPDESTLELLGDACATIQDGDEHEIDATFPCEIFDPIR